MSHAAPDDPDDLPEYVFLGRGRDAEPDDGFDDEFDDGDDERNDRRTKVVALAGLAVALLIVVVAIVLVSFIDTSRPSAPGTPQAAAEQWGNAVLHGHRTQRNQLECFGGSPSGDLLQQVSSSASGVHAARVAHTGANRWRVTLNVDGIGDGATFAVVVIRDHGTYEVC